jgi:hypothetical protein
VKATLPSALDAEHQKMLDDLKAKSGKDFDQSYDQVQLKAHRDAVALFEAYAKGGDNAEQHLAPDSPAGTMRIVRALKLRPRQWTPRASDRDRSAPRPRAGIVNPQRTERNNEGPVLAQPQGHPMR